MGEEHGVEVLRIRNFVGITIAVAGTKTNLSQWVDQGNDWLFSRIDGSIDSLNGFCGLFGAHTTKNDCDGVVFSMLEHCPEALWNFLGVVTPTSTLRCSLSEFAAFSVMLSWYGVREETLSCLLDLGLYTQEADCYMGRPSVLHLLCCSDLSAIERTKCFYLLLWHGFPLDAFNRILHKVLGGDSVVAFAYPMQPRDATALSIVRASPAAADLVNCARFAYEELLNCHAFFQWFFEGRWNRSISALVWNYLPCAESLRDSALNLNDLFVLDSD